MYTTIREELIAEGKAEGKAEGIVEGEARGIARGIARGKAELLMRLLGTRGLVPTDELRARVDKCTDEALLQRWFDRAVNAVSLTEIFDD